MTDKQIKDCHAEAHYLHEQECSGEAHKQRQRDDNVVGAWMVFGICVLAYGISYAVYKIMMAI